MIICEADYDGLFELSLPKWFLILSWINETLWFYATLVRISFYVILYPRGIYSYKVFSRDRVSRKMSETYITL